MIGKIAAKGRGFRGLSAYLLGSGRGRIVAGVMAGRTPRELSKEFGVLRRLNPKLTKAVAHLMLSPAPTDPPLTDAQWLTIAERYIEAMGFGNAPWVAVVHQDTDHQHMHLMACRIGFDGKTISDANDFRKSEAIVRRIETEFGLAAVPSVDSFKPKSHARAIAQKKTTPHQGDHTMTDSTILPNPFDPSDSQHATWPQPFEPGRDQAELAIINTSPSIVMPGASMAAPLTIKQAQNLRRAIVEDDYPLRMQTVLGDDLTRVFRHADGATLYFKQSGRIADQGRKLIVLGGMDEKLAAQRVVALGCERGWQTISFTGSGSFVELAMREALNQRLIVIAGDARQEAILAKVMAERQQGASAIAMPTADYSDNDDIIKLLDELDVLPGQLLPQPSKPTLPIVHVVTPLTIPASPAVPKPPQVGVLPRFLNLPERLQERREQKLSITPPIKQPGCPKP
ncbi:relaxase/mobilization nuclease domain-containing protein [Massilia sp. CCM 8695]|uniref:Relaxase/mobilization nuclease domain-containing protein n=1 Tax=Massilia frigida TaxID=2609281 RepID=A0ABX0N861_9BURK|nr:relaxase/mobilization nuclease domain-containing protein [Massilia frigida]NHZ81572.1 relaxase/mobilization nuclease domain-containing protein [Massilia frigida]